MSYKVFVVAGDNQALSALPSAVGAGIDVVLLQSSNEALWELQQSAPDVLVADVDLPGFSGVDLADLVPNFAPDTKIMLCARQPRGQVDAPTAQRVLLGEQSPGQIAAALDEVLAMAAPVRAA
ncbi:MAG TPA: response regulator, partial [Herpetosiphonaceae bacterium]